MTLHPLAKPGIRFKILTIVPHQQDEDRITARAARALAVEIFGARIDAGLKANLKARIDADLKANLGAKAIFQLMKIRRRVDWAFMDFRRQSLTTHPMENLQQDWLRVSVVREWAL